MVNTLPWDHTCVEKIQIHRNERIIIAITRLLFLGLSLLPSVAFLSGDASGVICIHHDVIKWKNFPRYWHLVRGNYDLSNTGVLSLCESRSILPSSYCLWICPTIPSVGVRFYVRQNISPPSVENLAKGIPHVRVTGVVRSVHVPLWVDGIVIELRCIDHVPDWIKSCDVKSYPLRVAGLIYSHRITHVLGKYLVFAGPWILTKHGSFPWQRTVLHQRHKATSFSAEFCLLRKILPTYRQRRDSCGICKGGKYVNELY